MVFLLPHQPSQLGGTINTAGAPVCHLSGPTIYNWRILGTDDAVTAQKGSKDKKEGYSACRPPSLVAMPLLLMPELQSGAGVYTDAVHQTVSKGHFPCLQRRPRYVTKGWSRLPGARRVSAVSVLT